MAELHLVKIFAQKYQSKMIREPSRERKRYHRKFMEALGKEMRFQKMEDWYNLQLIDLDHHGGKFLIKWYGSINKLVEQTFSEHKWKSWKFKPVPNGFWEDTKNHQKFVEWLGHHLGFKKMEDWYKLSGKDVEENGGDGLLSKFGNSPSKLLQNIYPEHFWIAWKFKTVPKGTLNQISRQEMKRGD